MNDIVITLDMLTLPDMFIQRFLVMIGGAGMFLHYLCMANAAPSKSPPIVWAFLMAIGFSLIGMTACAITGNVESMYKLLLAAYGSIVLFYLWLWANGMHVKDFLVQKYGA